MSGGILLEGDVTEDLGTTSCIVTKDGGIAILLKNNTGATSVKGVIVTVDTTEDNAVKLEPSGGNTCFGVIYSSGIPAGEMVWVVTSGMAYVLLEDASACVSGNWCITSLTQDGRVDATATTTPIGGDLAAHELHFKEVGHCLESKDAGTDVLTKIALHFN